MFKLNRSLRVRIRTRLPMSLILNLLAIKSLLRHSLMIGAAWTITWMSRLPHRKSAVMHAWMSSMMSTMTHIMLYHPVRRSSLNVSLNRINFTVGAKSKKWNRGHTLSTGMPFIWISVMLTDTLTMMRLNDIVINIVFW